MSLPPSEHWFSSSIRRNRKSFIYANILLIFFMVFVVTLLYFFDASQRAGDLIFFIFYLPFVIVQYFLTAQRLRDFGVSGWFSLLWLAIPFAPEETRLFLPLGFLFVLCSIPGTKGNNRFGEDPRL